MINKNSKDYLYLYKIINVEVIDGDTLKADIILGFNLTLTNEKLRLARINAPELSTPEGQASKAYLTSLFTPQQEFIIKSCKDKKEKYGRYLAEIFLDYPDKNLNDILVSNGYAIYHTY